MISSQAVVHGRTHRTMHQNGQDAAFSGRPAPGVAFGLVLDGCGSKHRNDTSVHLSRNEVGAHLLGGFLAHTLHTRLHASPDPDALHDILLALPDTAVAYLHTLLAPIPFPNAAARARFIATHLLTTLVGFVVTPETAVCFWLGDGYLRLNNTVIPLHSNNRPDYLAYRLFPDADSPPLSLLTIRQRNCVHTIAAASDGWTPALLTAINGPHPSLKLHRWLNVQARQRGQFEDDGAIAICWPSTKKAEAQGSRCAEENLLTDSPLATCDLPLVEQAP